MKIILQKDVVHLGEAGDIKEVADGYARNYLLPNRLALRADEGRTKAALHQKKMAELKKEKKKKSMKEIAEQIQKLDIVISVKTGENDKLYGSVTAIDIAEALAKQNIEVDKRKIEMPDHIKSLGTYKAKVKLSEGIVALVNIKVVKEETAATQAA